MDLRLCLCSFSPQHIEECCGWLRQKLDELNKEQYHIVHQHQEQVRSAVLYARAISSDGMCAKNDKNLSSQVLTDRQFMVYVILMYFWTSIMTHTP